MGAMLPHPNLVEPVLEHGERQPGRACLRFHRDGDWRSIPWQRACERFQAVAGGLRALGVGAGDRVAILSANRPEWAFADLGGIFAGAVMVSVYPTLPADEVAYILAHSRSRAVFVEDAAQAGKVRSVRDRLPELRWVIQLSGAVTDDGVTSLAELEASPTHADREAAVACGLGRRSEDALAVIYTSGTTGRPKGAVLTHGNVLFVLDAVLRVVPDTDALQYNLSFLPLAHAYERIAGLWLPLFMGRTITYARGLDTLAEDFRAIRPDFAVAVPRLFEKVHARILAQAEGKPWHARQLFRWSVAVGRRRSEHVEQGRKVPAGLAVRYAVADRLVFRKIRAALGGNIKILVSGGAPLATEIARFFHAAGLLICEGWGATETSAPATINAPGAFRLGSVGRPLPGVEVVVADDGELLVRGGNVCAGYLDDPEANAEAFDADGFYHTGDIGRGDEDGYFYITDRKKELIITSYGKNIAPQKIEGLLKQCRSVSNCLVHGDRRKHLVALITPDRAALESPHGELAHASVDDPGLAALVRAEVDEVNRGLPTFEQVRYFRLVEPDFSPETGELTPTLKLKRRVIEEKHRELLDGMYDPER